MRYRSFGARIDARRFGLSRFFARRLRGESRQVTLGQREQMRQLVAARACVKVTERGHREARMTPGKCRTRLRLRSFVRGRRERRAAAIDLYFFDHQSESRSEERRVG